MSRINYDIASQKEGAPNEEPPTMKRTQREATQLEPSHHEITEGIVANCKQDNNDGSRGGHCCSHKDSRRSWGSNSSP